MVTKETKIKVREIFGSKALLISTKNPQSNQVENCHLLKIACTWHANQHSSSLPMVDLMYTQPHCTPREEAALSFETQWSRGYSPITGNGRKMWALPICEPVKFSSLPISLEAYMRNKIYRYHMSPGVSHSWLLKALSLTCISFLGLPLQREHHSILRVTMTLLFLL